MRRSGSTLQYQIVNELLALSGNGTGIGYYESPEIEPVILKGLENDGRFAIKVHNYFPLAKELNNTKQAAFVYSYRDIRDVIVSSMNKWHHGSFKHCYSTDYVKILRKSHEDWTSIPDIYMSAYEDILADMAAEIKGIANYLGIDVDDNSIAIISDKLNIDSQKKRIEKTNYQEDGIITRSGLVDAKTNLHQNHIYSGEPNQWLESLTNFEIATIQREWKEWLLEYNYALHQTILNYTLPYFAHKYSSTVIFHMKKALLFIFRNTRFLNWYRESKTLI